MTPQPVTSTSLHLYAPSHRSSPTIARRRDGPLLARGPAGKQRGSFPLIRAQPSPDLPFQVRERKGRIPQTKPLSPLRVPHDSPPLPLSLCHGAPFRSAARSNGERAARLPSAENGASAGGEQRKVRVKGGGEPPREPGRRALRQPASRLSSARRVPARSPLTVPRLPRGSGDVTSAAQHPRARPAALRRRLPGPNFCGGLAGGGGEGRGWDGAAEPLRQHGQRRPRPPARPPRAEAARGMSVPRATAAAASTRAPAGGRAESAAAGAVAAAGAE